LPKQLECLVDDEVFRVVDEDVTDPTRESVESSRVVSEPLSQMAAPDDAGVRFELFPDAELGKGGHARQFTRRHHADRVS
jgi:hypothetical protein